MMDSVLGLIKQERRIKQVVLNSNNTVINIITAVWTISVRDRGAWRCAQL